MASSGSESKMSLKILVDIKSNKVVFAEAGKDFVDFIFQLMSLPLSTITKLLNEKELGMVGSLGALYKSIESLDVEYYEADNNKDSVLKPRDDVCVPLFSVNTGPSPPTKSAAAFMCPYHSSCVTDYQGTSCPICKFEMNSVCPTVRYAHPAKKTLSCGYLKRAVSYMVMDNLEVKPMSLSLIRSHVKDFDHLEEKQVEVGLQEGLAILKASMETKAVLTLWLHFGSANTLTDISPFQVFNKLIESIYMAEVVKTEVKLSLKIIVDTQANKVVFAEANLDFVDFIFSILSLPLATVVKLLNAKDMVSCLGSLYQSIESLEPKYFEAFRDKDSVLRPRTSVVNPLLSSNDTPTSVTYYLCREHNYISDFKGIVCPSCFSNKTMPFHTNSKYIAPKSYVKVLATYMVLDNLEIKPMSATLIKSEVQDFDPLVEKEVEIGLQEGLALLKASLETNSVLSTTKIIVNKKINKVIFAEADKQVVDLIFHILSLPLATVVKLLNENQKGVIGCLGDLYKGIDSLSNDYLQTNLDKNSVLDPMSAVVVPLLTKQPQDCYNYYGPKYLKFYFCASSNNCWISDRQGTFCPRHRSEMAQKTLEYVPRAPGYVKEAFMVMDNLEIKPMSVSLITSLLKDLTSFEERQVKFGHQEVINFQLLIVYMNVVYERNARLILHYCVMFVLAGNSNFESVFGDQICTNYCLPWDESLVTTEPTPTHQWSFFFF
ncbi:uncharacterized protein LOC110733687 [Chenopodium quinoa]|uniref:uncharacterized protein LOC110733687 n=1 Tax=Chenopodium quinoa TaxID=63459 RepID=UPI000B788310|nr:uncharacterized protein LOC110733687 [Chenopodium quinoa]